MRSLVGVFGDQNEAKLIDLVLAAVAALPADVHVALVGRRIEGYDLDAVVRCERSRGRGCTSAPTSATRTSWHGCARPTSPWTSGSRTAAR